MRRRQTVAVRTTHLVHSRPDEAAALRPTVRRSNATSASTRRAMLSSACVVIFSGKYRTFLVVFSVMKQMMTLNQFEIEHVSRNALQ